MNTPRLPFTDINVWEYLQRHAYVSEQYKLLYVATPKAACTSLKWWFATLEGYSKILSEITDSSESDPHLSIHDNFHKIAPAVTGLSPGSILKPLTSHTYFRFAVVRNPYTRIFSAWQSKLLLREPLQIRNYTKYDFFWRPTKNAIDIALAFEEFLEHLSLHEAPNYWDVHWTPQTRLLRPDLIAYTKLIKIEDAKELNIALAKRLGSSIPPPFGNKKMNESIIPYSPNLITKRAVVLIKSLYSEDFETFGYDDHQPAVKMHTSNSQIHTAIRAISLIRGRHQQLVNIHSNLEKQISSQTAAIVEIQQILSKRDEQIAILQEGLLERDERISAIVSSRSWKITKPCRFLGEIIHNLKAVKSGNVLRNSFNIITQASPFNSQLIYKILRYLYIHLPIPLETKKKWAEKLFSSFQSLRFASLKAKSEQILNFSLTIADNGLLIPPRQRILFVEHRLPIPDKNSSSLRLYSMLKLMVELGWEITFVSNTVPSSYYWVLSNISNELPKYENLMANLGITYLYGMQDALKHLQIEGGSYKYVILSYPEIMHLYAPLARAFAPNAKLIFDTVDLHGVRLAREAIVKQTTEANFIKKAQFYEQMEYANIASADLTITVTEVERNVILKHIPEARIAIVPNIHSISSTTPPFENRQGVLFIGHYLHSPNEDAMIYFVNEILPRIQKELGKTPLFMLGSSMTKSVKRLASNSVIAVGYVEDPVPWFDKARVFVAPLRYGAGMKGKIGQSLSLGLPAVTTSIGAEGMMLEHDKHILIADTPEDFANSVIRLYQDSILWDTLVENGKSHIGRNFSEASAREAIQKILSGGKELQEATSHDAL